MAINPTAYEQYMLELINWARANPGAQADQLRIDLNAGLSGGTISDAAKQPLVFNEALIAAARGHSNWMLDADTFSHTGANGSDAGDRMNAAGYEFRASYSWAENLAWNGTTGPIDIGVSVLANHHGLFESGGHRANMLNGDHKEIGIGVETGTFTDASGNSNALMVTQNFALSGSASYLTGVVIDDQDGDRFYDIGEGRGGATITATGSAGIFETSTWDAGGYRLELPPGSYDVTVTLGGESYDQAITIGSENVKLDAFADEMQPRDGDHDDSVAGDAFVSSSADEDFVGTTGFDVIFFPTARADVEVDVAAEGTIIVDGAATGHDTLTGFERLSFSDGTLAFDTGAGETAGQAYRIYQAAFDREPDAAGLSYWIQQMDRGASLQEVAVGFVASDEFAETYGSTPFADAFVEQLYQNVLGRSGDPAGVGFWVEILAEGGTAADVLAGISESPENVAGVAPSVADGIWYA